MLRPKKRNVCVPRSRYIVVFAEALPLSPTCVVCRPVCCCRLAANCHVAVGRHHYIGDSRTDIRLGFGFVSFTADGQTKRLSTLRVLLRSEQALLLLLLFCLCHECFVLHLPGCLRQRHSWSRDMCSHESARDTSRRLAPSVCFLYKLTQY